MELLYDDAAKAAGVYVASAVGFDSVPGDLGVQARRGALLCCWLSAVLCSQPAPLALCCCCGRVPLPAVPYLRLWLFSCPATPTSPTPCLQYTLAQFKPPARCTQVECALTIQGGPNGFRGVGGAKGRCRWQLMQAEIISSCFACSSEPRRWFL